MSQNLALECREFDDYLVDTYQDVIHGYVGAHYIFRFPNAYGASVVKTFGSEGFMQDLWELAVIVYDEKDKLAPDEYELAYPYSILGDRDVLGYLTDKEVREILTKIKNLKD